jgi:autotransporter-associated beta strand protein
MTLQVSGGTPSITATDITARIYSTLAGTQGLSKQGNGTVVLSGANTYTGTTSISAGGLRAAHNNALGSTSGITSIGNAADARLELENGLTISEPITIGCKGSANGNVPAVVNVSGTNTLSGTLTLTTGGSFWTFEAASGKLRVTGNATNTTTTNVRSIWLRGTAVGEWSGVIGDSAAALSTAVRKDDSGVWILSGNNIYTGNTTVSNGTLLVNGTVAGAGISVYGGALLGGTGVITAPVTIFPGATFSPGTSIGTLTINNSLVLSAGSSTFVEVNAQTLGRDFVTGLSSVTYGGTLYINNLAGTLTAGQSFQLFNAVSASGNFSNILPAPGAGLAWDFNPASGTLGVVSTAPPQVTSWGIDGSGNFTISGSGPNGQPYRVLATTNVALPVGSWTPVVTGSFSGGVFSFTDPQTSGSSQRFYRVVVP